MAPIRRFEDIEAWQAARKLSQACEKVVSESRTFTNLSLKDQLGRCTDSAMANIAEGFDSSSDREFIRFLNISYRSVSEFQSHLYCALDWKQLDQAAFDALYEEARVTKGLIGGFRHYLEGCLGSKVRPVRPKR